MNEVKRYFPCMMAIIMIVAVAGGVYAALTGVIGGKIEDSAGNPLPGVTVTITSPNLQGDRTAYTNENGVYRFPELPPGAYELTAEMMGMKTIKYPEIDVKVNKTTQINLQMAMTEVSMTIEVTADAPVVDVTTTTQAVNIEKEFTDKLPGNMDYQDAMTMSAGMVGGGNPQVHGGTKQDNVYLLDGVDTTDSLTGTFGSNVAADALEQVEVQTGGFSAEYGRALGGIVNAVTKSGGNKFSGSLRVQYRDNTWESSSFYETTEPERDVTWLPTLTLGGPIMKDRIWFFITAWYYNDSSEADILSDPADDKQDPSATVDTDRTIIRPYVKLTLQPVSAHKFTLKWNEENWEDENDNAGNNVTAAALTNYEQGGPFYGADWTWLISASTFMNFQAAFSEVVLNSSIPANGDYGTPGFTDEARGITDRAPTEFRKNSRNRWNFNLSLSWFMDEFIKGSHDFKVGAEYQHLWVEREVGIPGGFYYTFNTTVAGQPADTLTEVFSGGMTKYYGYYGALFVQDSWKFKDNMTFNWGFRPEFMWFQNDVKKAKTEEISGGSQKLGTDDYVAQFTSIAPRFGFSWDLRGKGTDKLTVVLARYYNPSNLQIPQMLNETDTVFRTYYRETFTDLPDESKYDYSGSEEKFMDNPNRYPDGSSWQIDTTGTYENTNTVDPDLKPEYSDEFQIGSEHEVFDNVSVGWTYTYRKTTDLIEDVGVWFKESTGEYFLAWDVPYDEYRDDVEQRMPDRDYSLDHYLVTNLPSSADREYNGLEFTLRTQRKNFTFLGSYTYAVAEGTVYGDQPGFSGGGYSGSGTVSSFSEYYDTPDLSRNVSGKLPYDINHYVKLNPAYDFFPNKIYAFSLGATYFYRNGYAYSRRFQEPQYGDNSVYPGEPNKYHPEWADMESGQGTYRLPPVASMDLSIQKHFPIQEGKFGTFTVIFDIFNIFNNEYLLQRTMDDKWESGRPQVFGTDGAHMGVRSYRLSMLFKF